MQRAVSSVWPGPGRNQGVPQSAGLQRPVPVQWTKDELYRDELLFFPFIFYLFLLVVPHPIGGSETWSFWVLSILFQSKTALCPLNQTVLVWWMFTVMFTPMAIRCLTCFCPISIPVMTLNQILHKRLGSWCRCSLVYTQWFWRQILDSGQGFKVFSVYADCHKFFSM